VSNHGGRNLDASIPPIEALPQVLAAVGSRMDVFVDSGFTRGSHVAKAIAMGAKGVLLGRAPLWGVASSGEHGATRALQIMQQELQRVMCLAGCASLENLDLDLLHFTGIGRPALDVTQLQGAKTADLHILQEQS
jgi:isopentenyl diphosphate isomerase/L-lactate dehydrogenase-like FMN-dependent dehydrogenase